MTKVTPTLEIEGWELVDGEVAAQQYPATFRIPSLTERETLRAGDLARLRFVLRADDGGLPVTETMRVRVQEASVGGYRGVLEDSPATSSVIAPGQNLEFEPRHVVGVTVPQTDPRHPLYAKTAMGRFARRLRALWRA